MVFKSLSANPTIQNGQTHSKNSSALTEYINMLNKRGPSIEPSGSQEPMITKIIVVYLVNLYQGHAHVI